MLEPNISKTVKR